MFNGVPLKEIAFIKVALNEIAFVKSMFQFLNTFFKSNCSFF